MANGEKVTPTRLINGVAVAKDVMVKLKMDEENISPKIIGVTDNPVATLKFYEKQIVGAKIENAVIVTVTGTIYHCTGKINELDDTILELAEKLTGASVTHNHPVGSENEYTFSDSDVSLFEKYKLKILRGIDEKYTYELNRNADDIDEFPSLEEILKSPEGELSQHAEVIRKAMALNLGYRRRAR